MCVSVCVCVFECVCVSVCECVCVCDLPDRKYAGTSPADPRVMLMRVGN